MPKSKPPKYSKLRQYAVIYLDGKAHYLGQYNSPESRAAYARFEAEWWQNARLAIESRSRPANPPRSSGVPANHIQEVEQGTTVNELAASFLDYAKATLAHTCYNHHRIVVTDFLTKFYGDIPADSFKPSCLKLVRLEMIRSGRFCRKLTQVPQRWLGSKIFNFFLADFALKSPDFDRKRVENESKQTTIALYFFQKRCSGKKFF